MLEQTIGRLARQTIVSYTTYLDRFGEKNGVNTAGLLMQTLAGECERALEPNDERALHVLSMLSYNLYRQERYTECVATCDRLQHISSLLKNAEEEFGALWMSALSYKEMNELEMAEIRMLEAANIGDLDLDSNEKKRVPTLDAYCALVEWYREWNRSSEADALERRISEIVPKEN